MKNNYVLPSAPKDYRPDLPTSSTTMRYYADILAEAEKCDSEPKKEKMDEIKHDSKAKYTEYKPK